MAESYACQVIESVAEIIKSMIEKGFFTPDSTKGPEEICASIEKIKKALDKDIAA